MAKSKTTKGFLTALKIIGIVFYSTIWFCVEIIVLFIFQIMPPPWRVFKKGKSYTKDYSHESHNWDKNYTDLEYYDMVDDD